MTTKKLYIIDFGGKRIYTESQESAFELFRLLDKGDIIELHHELDDEYRRRFHYPGCDRFRLFSETVDLFKDENEAKLARDSFNKARKMKLIKRKKP